jgi:DNA (cytosine-5)-methyltransferase 1
MVDLFSGCGGLSLGFAAAGCVSLAGVDLDPDAARSYARNFHAPEAPEIQARHATPRDITALDPAALLSPVGVQAAPRTVVDLIVGGPPCPAFTRVGRAKLRSVTGDPGAFLNDPRAQLWRHYVRFVRELLPMALVMENVPEIMNFGRQNLAEVICTALGELGYVCRYSLQNAAHFGVPQFRTRFFLVAVHRLAGVEPRFPAPTHRAELPRGYLSAMDVALRCVRSQGTNTHHVEALPPPPEAPPAVTLREAFADLPPLDPLAERSTRALAREAHSVPYARDVQPDSYAGRMRNWAGLPRSTGISGHQTRRLGPRDQRLFVRMEPGSQYPRAIEIAEEELRNELEREARRCGRPLTETETAALRSAWVPPYDPTKFPNKWCKLDPDRPSPTLTAHIGKDTYSHIHFDDDQRRVISVREAARIQSIPDSFALSGSMNAAFRQIGNAVCPVVARALAEATLGALCHPQGPVTGTRATAPAHASQSPGRGVVAPHFRSV